MKQVNAVPDRAATFVVHPTPGIGDATTIQEALDMLPASGGSILVREGTYALTLTITLPDKPVSIFGCGDATIIDLGANVIDAFTIPDGLTALRNYNLQNFKVTGNSVALQALLSIQDATAFGVSTLRNIRTEGVRTTIDIIDGDVNFLTPVLVSVYDSWFVPVAAGNSALCNSNGNAFPMDIAFYSTKFMVDDFSGVGGTIDDDSFGSVNVAFFDCHLSLTGEDGLATIHAERCKIFNFSGTPEIIFLNGNFASDDDLPQSAFINCNVYGLWIVDGGGMTVQGGWWINNRIETGLVNGRSSIVGVSFRGIFGSLAVMPTDLGNACFIEHSGQDLSVVGCTFSDFGVVTNYIRVVSDIEITNCDFRGLDAASEAGIRITGVNNHLTDNSFDTDGWGCPPILEVAPADRNLYHHNLGINGNGGVGSTFVGIRNTFNGVTQHRASAATVNAFTDIHTQLATSGVIGIGTIKNIGANGMNVRETVIDQFGVTSSVTTLVAAGADRLLDPNINIGTARPAYRSYIVAVQSAVPGSPTTYDMRLGMNGEVTW